MILLQDLKIDGSIANDPFFSPRHHPADIVLFRRVILQAIIDAISRPKKAKKKKWKREAIAWIFDKGTNFLDDCYIADMDAATIRRVVECKISSEPPEEKTKRKKDYERKQKYKQPVQLCLFE